MRCLRKTEEVVDVYPTVAVQEIDIPASVENAKDFREAFMLLGNLIDSRNVAHFNTSDQACGTEMSDFAFELSELTKLMRRIADKNAHEYVHGLMIAAENGPDISQSKSIFSLGRKHGEVLIGLAEGEV